MRNPFQIDEAQLAEYRRQYKDAVQPRLDEEVLAVGPFQRTGQYFLTIPLIGQLGLVFYLIYQARNKQRAGSLPMNFLLAVTPTKVHAFKYRPGGYGSIKLKHEVAVWRRADIRVAEVVDGAMSSRVTLIVNENGETIRIACNTPQMGGQMFGRPALDLIGSGTTAESSEPNP